ncbi:DUF3397 domain-containing protein [Bacillus sp. AK031]
MSSIISNLVAIFTLLPFLGYFTTFILMKQITGKHKKAVNAAVNVTTFLLIVAVHFIVLAIWNKSYLWIIMLVMIVSTGLLSVIHWKIKEEVIFRSVIKGGWRLNFLLFSMAYIILMLYGTASRIVDSL